MDDAMTKGAELPGEFIEGAKKDGARIESSRV